MVKWECGLFSVSILVKKAFHVVSPCELKLLQVDQIFTSMPFEMARVKTTSSTVLDSRNASARAQSWSSSSCKINHASILD